MLTRFIKITNGLSFLSDDIDNDQKIRKVIKALFKSWEVKATTLKELNDNEEMDFSSFIGNLNAHEMEMKVWEEREPQKKKNITFTATPSIPEDDEFMDENEEDEFVMLFKKVKKMWANSTKKKRT